MIIDTHAHLSSERFNDDRAEAFARAKAAGVGAIIEVGDTIEQSYQACAMTQQYAMLYASVGVHPYYALEVMDKPRMRALQHVANSSDRVVAWGEIGLDYYRYSTVPKEDQIRAFTMQIEYAQECSLPLIIHCRDAHEDMQRIIGGYNRQWRGVIHAFNGTRDEALFYTRHGFKLGIGGPVTYPSNRALHDAVQHIPLEHIIVETDTPYLPPQSYRGKRNEPSYITHVIDRIAALRRIGADEVIRETTANAQMLFGIAS